MICMIVLFLANIMAAHTFTHKLDILKRRCDKITGNFAVDSNQTKHMRYADLTKPIIVNWLTEHAMLKIKLCTAVNEFSGSATKAVCDGNTLLKKRIQLWTDECVSLVQEIDGTNMPRSSIHEMIAELIHNNKTKILSCDHIRNYIAGHIQKYDNLTKDSVQEVLSDHLTNTINNKHVMDDIANTISDKLTNYNTIMNDHITNINRTMNALHNDLYIKYKDAISEYIENINHKMDMTMSEYQKKLIMKYRIAVDCHNDMFTVYRYNNSMQ